MVSLRHTVRIGLALALMAGGCAHQAGRGSAGVPPEQECPPVQPPVHRPLPAPDAAAELRQKLEYSLEYALDYGLTCALEDTLESPPEEVRRNPLRCGLRVGFEDALEWSLRHILDPEQKAAPQEAFRAARDQALANARAEGLSASVEAALNGIKLDAAARDALKTTLLKTLGDCIEESLDFALDNALHGEPDTQAAAGPFVWPINHPGSYITSTFGYRGKGGHAGVDIVVPRGTPIAAAAEGTITFAGDSRCGYGRMVKIEHEHGIETWYAHMDVIGVREGEHVAQGGSIGQVGRTGHATCPHLHYEVHEDGHPVDPRPYLP